jgi:CYTH domain-containing protein
MAATATGLVEEVVGRYRDADGTLHRVMVRLAGGAWEIVDRALGEEPVVIDRLAGREESRLTAEAVARDWIGQRVRDRRRDAEQE